MNFKNESFQHFYLGIVHQISNHSKIEGTLYRWENPEQDVVIPDSDFLESLTDQMGEVTQLVQFESVTNKNFKVYFSFHWDRQPLAWAYPDTSPASEHAFQFLSGLAIVLLDENEDEIVRIDSSPDHREQASTFPFHVHRHKSIFCFHPSRHAIALEILNHIS